MDHHLAGLKRTWYLRENNVWPPYFASFFYLKKKRFRQLQPAVDHPDYWIFSRFKNRKDGHISAFSMFSASYQPYLFVQPLWPKDLVPQDTSVINNIINTHINNWHGYRRHHDILQPAVLSAIRHFPSLLKQKLSAPTHLRQWDPARGLLYSFPSLPHEKRGAFSYITVHALRFSFSFPSFPHISSTVSSLAMSSGWKPAPRPCEILGGCKWKLFPPHTRRKQQSTRIISGISCFQVFLDE